MLTDIPEFLVQGRERKPEWLEERIRRFHSDK
jgi:hypothetical protein